MNLIIVINGSIRIFRIIQLYISVNLVVIMLYRDLSVSNNSDYFFLGLFLIYWVNFLMDDSDFFLIVGGLLCNVLSGMGGSLFLICGLRDCLSVCFVVNLFNLFYNLLNFFFWFCVQSFLKSFISCLFLNCL